jgi:hypothetical protein
VVVRFVDRMAPSGFLRMLGLHDAAFDEERFYLLDAQRRRARVVLQGISETAPRSWAGCPPEQSSVGPELFSRLDGPRPSAGTRARSGPLRRRPRRSGSRAIDGGVLLGGRGHQWSPHADRVGRADQAGGRSSNTARQSASVRTASRACLRSGGGKKSRRSTRRSSARNRRNTVATATRPPPRSALPSQRRTPAGTPSPARQPFPQPTGAPPPASRDERFRASPSHPPARRPRPPTPTAPGSEHPQAEPPVRRPPARLPAAAACATPRSAVST